jgi:hypothetical protein
MDLNPLSVIEKWLTEHGSSAILGDHAAMLREKLEAVSREMTHLRAENARLEADNKELRSQLPDHAAEVHRAQVPEQKIEKATKPERRPEMEEKILLCLTDGKKLPAAGIAEHMECSVDKADALLNRLKKSNLVFPTIITGQPIIWMLSPGGKDYLVDLDLVK